MPQVGYFAELGFGDGAAVMELWEDWVITEHGMEAVALPVPTRNMRYRQELLTERLTSASAMEGPELPADAIAMWKWVVQAQTMETMVVGLATQRYLPHTNGFTEPSHCSVIAFAEGLPHAVASCCSAGVTAVPETDVTTSGRHQRSMAKAKAAALAPTLEAGSGDAVVAPHVAGFMGAPVRRRPAAALQEEPGAAAPKPLSKAAKRKARASTYQERRELLGQMGSEGASGSGDPAGSGSGAGGAS